MCLYVRHIDHIDDDNVGVVVTDTIRLHDGELPSNPYRIAQFDFLAV